MPKINFDKVALKTGSIYPDPYADEMIGRSSLRLGDANGLSQFGANITILAPGAKSSLRHWHQNEDECVMVIKGTVRLIEDDGETLLSIGECAAFPAGIENGHHFINKTDTEARFLVIGTRADFETVLYSDIDLKVEIKASGFDFTRKNGLSLCPPSERDEND